MITNLQTQLKHFLGDLYSPLVTFCKILVVIILAVIIVKLGKKIIKKLFEKQKQFKYRMNEKRIDTMATLTISIFKYAVYIGAVLYIFTDMLKLKSVIAAAGVGGIALGFGAQSLIKDTISGFFIILEDQFSVGDLITIDTLTGTVENMELRITRLKNANGDTYIIPNGEIKKVINHTRDNKLVIVDIPVAYSSNLEKVNEIAQNVCQQVKQEFTVLTEEPSVLGITEFGSRNMNLRITAKALPNEQWPVERRIRLLVKQGFDDNGLEFYDRTLLTKPFGNE